MTAERKALLTFVGIALVEGSWLFSFWGLSFARILRWFGITQPVAHPVTTWAAAALVTIAYCVYARRLPSVAATMFHPDTLKLAALCASFSASLCEEGVFRRILMNSLSNHGAGVVVQVVLSALAFGAVHSVWGLLKGSLRAAIAAMAATGILGLALAVVYLLGGRNLFPCALSHFLVTAIIEPGLVLAALRGEMGRTPLVVTRS